MHYGMFCPYFILQVKRERDEQTMYEITPVKHKLQKGLLCHGHINIPKVGGIFLLIK